MTYYIVKVAITVLLIVTISEVSKKNVFLGSLLASLPLVSFLAMIWLYVDTKDTEKVAQLSISIFWLVLPSLFLFLLLPELLKKWSFPVSLTASTLAMIGFYLLTIFLAKKVGFHV